MGEEKRRAGHGRRPREEEQEREERGGEKKCGKKEGMKREKRRRGERNKERWNDSGTSFPVTCGATYFFLRGRRLASWRYERKQSHHTPSAAQSAHAKTETRLLPRGTEKWYAPYQCNHGLVRQVYGQSSWLCRIKPSLGTDLPAWNGGENMWHTLQHKSKTQLTSLYRNVRKLATMDKLF